MFIHIYMLIFSIYICLAMSKLLHMNIAVAYRPRSMVGAQIDRPEYGMACQNKRNSWTRFAYIIIIILLF